MYKSNHTAQFFSKGQVSHKSLDFSALDDWQLYVWMSSIKKAQGRGGRKSHDYKHQIMCAITWCCSMYWKRRGRGSKTHQILNHKLCSLEKWVFLAVVVFFKIPKAPLVIFIWLLYSQHPNIYFANLSFCRHLGRFCCCCCSFIVQDWGINTSFSF